MFLLLFLLEMLQKYKLLPRVTILTLLLKLAKPLSRLSSCCISPLQIPILMSVLYHNDIIMKKEKEFFIICLCTSINNRFVGYTTHFAYFNWCKLI